MKSAAAILLALVLSGSTWAADWSVTQISRQDGKKRTLTWSGSALSHGKAELAIGDTRTQVPVGIASDLRDRVAKLSMKPSRREPGCESYWVFESSLGKSQQCAAELGKSSEAVTLLGDLERLRAKAQRQ